MSSLRHKHRLTHHVESAKLDAPPQTLFTRPVSGRSRAHTNTTFWTSKTGVNISRPTNAHGVSTVAKQRQQKREKERAQHLEDQHARESTQGRLLRVRIKSTKENLKRIQERRDQLLKENQILYRKLTTYETSSMDYVDNLLHRYGQFAKANATITRNFDKTLEEAKADYEAYVDKLEEQIAEFQADVAQLSKKIEKGRQDLHALFLYRENGHLELRRMIFGLKEALVKQQVQHKQEKRALTKEIALLRKNMHSKWKERVEDMHSSHSNGLLLSMEPSVRASILQNMQMREDIAYHQNEQKEARSRISALEDEQRLLRATIDAQEGEKTELISLRASLRQAQRLGLSELQVTATAARSSPPRSPPTMQPTKASFNSQSEFGLPQLQVPQEDGESPFGLRATLPRGVARQSTADTPMERAVSRSRLDGRAEEPRDHASTLGDSHQGDADVEGISLAMKQFQRAFARIPSPETPIKSSPTAATMTASDDHGEVDEAAAILALLTPQQSQESFPAQAWPTTQSQRRQTTSQATANSNSNSNSNSSAVEHDHAREDDPLLRDWLWQAREGGRELEADKRRGLQLAQDAEERLKSIAQIASLVPALEEWVLNQDT